MRSETKWALACLAALGLALGTFAYAKGPDGPVSIPRAALFCEVGSVGTYNETSGAPEPELVENLVFSGGVFSWTKQGIAHRTNARCHWSPLP